MALGWLWGGYWGPTAWLPSGIDVALGWLARPVTNHESRITSGFGWLCPAFRCWKLDVGCSMFGVHDKSFEYNSPRPPPREWSGGTLDIPWTCPIPIDPPQNPIFDQASLSKLLSCGFAAGRILTPPPERRSHPPGR